jgi:pimeloyl-ACP methyl ester carboxylesterase
VIFQHGLGGSAQQVAEIFPILPAVRRITLECRAHGQSDAGPTDRFAIAAFAEDVVALSETLGIKRAILGGISMGATIAQRIAVTHSDLVEGLILVRRAWLDRAAPANLRPSAEVAQLLAHHPPDTARAQFLASPTAAELHRLAPDNLASLLNMFDSADPATTSTLLAAIARDGPGTTSDAIRKIAAPALVIGSKADFVHPLEYALALHGMIERSVFVEVTAKSVDLAAYRIEVAQAIERFLGEGLQT